MQIHGTHRDRVITGDVKFSLPYPRTQLWEYFSNTDWLDRAVGLPFVEYTSRKGSNGEPVVEARARMGGVTLRWRELPFEWLRPEFSMVRREFIGGPFENFEGGIELEETSGGSCLRVRSRFTPRNRFGGFLVRRVIHPITRARLSKAVRRVSEILQSRSGPAGRLPALNRSPVNESQLADGLDFLRRKDYPQTRIDQLADLLRNVDDVEAIRLRPFEIAGRWNAPKWDVLRLFLDATRAGLLDLSWEVICPSCLEDREPKRTLAELHSGVHCAGCQIAFDAEFDRSVELKFSINASVRNVSSKRTCAGGVNFRQECIRQLTVEPETPREIDWALEEGRYFLRSDALAKAIPFAAAAGGKPAVELTVGEDGIARMSKTVAVGEQRWSIVNHHKYPVTLRVEHLHDRGDMLTAAEVTSWQEFRDLFSREIVAPEERIAIGQQVFLFTDLRGSTELYHRVGDASAYARVRDHFQLLTGIVKRRHGAVVKTIGDAVMAVFSSASEALNAAIEMQLDLERSPHAGEPLKLKAAVHMGPCLAVNANDRIDYFGSTVNYAARLLGVCGPAEVVLSNAVHQNAQVLEFLQRIPLEPTAFQCTLRGVSAEQTVWRLSPPTAVGEISKL